MTNRKLTKKAFAQIEKRNEAKKLQTELLLPKIPKLSQSLVKSLYKYKMKQECGLRIHASYIDGINFPSTDAQELGNYFEFMATGQLPRDNHTPTPKILKNGNYSLEYERMNKQVENFKNVMKRMNFEIEKTGFKFTNPEYDGIADIIALDKNIKTKVKNKQRVIIDTKTSALINDKWSPYGWAEESIEEKWDLTIQAIHYKMLARYEWGVEDVPFYFFVFSTKNDWEYKIYKINVDEDTMNQHYINLKNIKVYLDDILKGNGFQANPTYALCRECPLQITCKSFMDTPKVIEVCI
jgi:hypothetical protein